MQISGHTCYYMLMERNQRKTSRNARVATRGTRIRVLAGLVAVGASALGCSAGESGGEAGRPKGTTAVQDAAGVDAFEFTGPWFAEYAEVPLVAPQEDQFGDPVPSGAMVRSGSEAVAVFDVDGDGTQDFVTADGRSFLQVALVRRGADGELIFEESTQSVGVVGDGRRNAAKALGLHDFDHDGHLDVYAPNSGQGGIQADDPRDLANIAEPGNLVDKGTYLDAGHRYLINNVDGTFTDTGLGEAGDGTTRSALFADFDGDGNTDAYLSQGSYFGIWWGGSSKPNMLLPGRDDGTFGADMLSQAVVNDDGTLFRDEFGRSNKDFKGATVRDFDGDGRPDIIAGAYADVWDNVMAPTQPALPEGNEIDLDLDGDPDGGYQGTWARGILVLRNVSEPGSIRFEDVSNDAIENAFGTTDQAPTYVAIPADIDGDADFDLLASGPRNFTAHGSLEHQTPRIRVYRNDSNPGQLDFADVTDESGLDYLNHDDQLPEPYTDAVRLPGVMSDGTDLILTPLWSAGAALDIDNDTDLDWVAVDRQFIPNDPETGQEFVMWVFLNDGSGHFEAADAATHGLAHTARDFSYGDLNGDGRLDLVVANGSGGGQEVADTNYVYLNTIDSPNHYAFVAVDDGPGNPLGIGTTVTITAPGTDTVIGHDEVRTDFAYRSRRDTSLHFGLGDLEHFDVTVRTRDGETRTFTNLPADQTQTLDLTRP